jgi:hypothetical protein
VGESVVVCVAEDATNLAGTRCRRDARAVAAASLERNETLETRGMSFRR